MKKTGKVVAIVECRMTSSRLPGKVLLESCGKPLLAHLVERLKRARGVDEVLLATTTNLTDDPIVALAERLEIPCFRGSENDVLGRVHDAAHFAQADVVIEVTGDCPLIDPEIVAQTLELYRKSSADYVANDLIPSFPIGMNVAIFSTALLEAANREGTRPEDREHVAWFFVRNPERFAQKNLLASPDLRDPDLRLTLDEKDDYRLIDTVFQRLYVSNPDFSCGDILRLLKEYPEIRSINAHVRQNALPEV
jgi:spore coat polysaccharide biosynthesis protein SpsF